MKAVKYPACRKEEESLSCKLCVFFFLWNEDVKQEIEAIIANQIMDRTIICSIKIMWESYYGGPLYFWSLISNNPHL